jgi:hypothetical protein
MRRVLLALVLVVAAAVAPSAKADLNVGFAPATGIVLSPEGTSGWRAIIEHFADATRNGTRVRQIGLGDPRITTNSGPLCSENVVLNDVVCNGLPVLVQQGLFTVPPVELVVGGSNTGCEPDPPVGVIADLGPGDDIVRPRFACGGQENVTGDNRLSPQFFVRGGPGNDSLTGGRLGDTFDGESGNDTILGGVGADNLTGGDGNDTIRGQGGEDLMTGGPGADILDGGGQNDTVRYDVTSNVTVTLDAVANDGRSGEGDNVIDVESVVTGAGNDRVTGSSASETIDSGAGNDILIPAAGTDTARAGAGADLIDARDGARDVVTCGPGVDEVIADLSDNVLVLVPLGQPKDNACERVERFAVDDGPPGRIRVRAVAIRADGRLRVPVFCPRRARVSCSGTLRLADNRRLSRTLAQARYTVPRGATIRVPLRLARVQADRARARGSITVITRERGVSKKGPRSAITTLSVSRG